MLLLLDANKTDFSIAQHPVPIGNQLLTCQSTLFLTSLSRTVVWDLQTTCRKFKRRDSSVGSRTGAPSVQTSLDNLPVAEMDSSVPAESSPYKAGFHVDLDTVY